MLVSTANKFIFIHVPKTAGSSITAALAPYSLKPEKTALRRVLSKLPVKEDIGQAYFRTHATADQVRRKFPQHFKDYLTFAVVRNPYDYAVSYYEYNLARKKKNLFGKSAGWTFADFLKEAQGKSKKTSFSQSKWLTDENNNIIVDRILKFETINKDIVEIASEIGIEVMSIPHKNSTVRRPFWKYYGQDEVRMANDLFAIDFQNFGYKMMSYDQMMSAHEQGRT